MIFVYKAWDEFCERLSKLGIQSVPAAEAGADNSQKTFLVLKHDVETDVNKALEMAKIEHSHNHRGSYYVQAYLLDKEINVIMLQEIQSLGHEVSYHYDVMDSNKGDIDLALLEFIKNKELFEEKGFTIKTVCQHGNPVVERVGYSSNRDFFRNEKVRKMFPELSDIMVNFKDKYNKDYNYFSDAGRKFKLIYDPINNDIINSDDKNMPFESLDDLLIYINGENCIISTHPHRWTDSKLIYLIKLYIFKIIKSAAKIAIKLPFIKKIMGKFYYLAKKI